MWVLDLWLPACGGNVECFGFVLVVTASIAALWFSLMAYLYFGLWIVHKWDGVSPLCAPWRKQSTNEKKEAE